MVPAGTAGGEGSLDAAQAGAPTQSVGEGVHRSLDPDIRRRQVFLDRFEATRTARKKALVAELHRLGERGNINEKKALLLGRLLWRISEEERDLAVPIWALEFIDAETDRQHEAAHLAALARDTGRAVVGPSPLPPGGSERATSPPSPGMGAPESSQALVALTTSDARPFLPLGKRPRAEAATPPESPDAPAAAAQNEARASTSEPHRRHWEDATLEAALLADRRRSHAATSPVPPPPSGRPGAAAAWAWLTPAGLAAADSAEVLVPRSAVPHLVERGGKIINLIEDVTGLVVGVADGDGGEVTITLFGPKDRLDWASNVVRLVAKGARSLLRRIQSSGVGFLD